MVQPQIHEVHTPVIFLGLLEVLLTTTSTIVNILSWHKMLIFWDVFYD